jgi:hypothetical protein
MTEQTSTCGNCGSLDVEAVHWNSPTGTTVVAWSCSEVCGDFLESLRDANGKLTRRAIVTARKPDLHPAGGTAMPTTRPRPPLNVSPLNVTPELLDSLERRGDLMMIVGGATYTLRDARDVLARLRYRFDVLPLSLSAGDQYRVVRADKWTTQEVMTYPDATAASDAAEALELIEWRLATPRPTTGKALP